MKFAKYWQGEDGIRNVIPMRSGELYPEGFDVHEVLKSFIDSEMSVVEVGCGYGRLCEAFDYDLYLGVDCNSAAVERATVDYAPYQFMTVRSYDYPESEVKLAYTVALHIPDEEFSEFVWELCDTTFSQVLVAEIMDQRLRKELTKKDVGWLQPTFGRSRQTFRNEFLKNGFELESFVELPYPTKGKMTFLSFKRKGNDED